MTRHVRRPWALALVALWMIGGWTLQGQERPEVTAAQVDEWMQELSNWGRWGADDQLGAVNLITPAKRRAALALATAGEVVSLSLPVSVGEPPDDPDSTAAFTSLRVVDIPSGFLMERQQVAFHGSTVSHLDALCHAHHDGQIYNGLALEDVFTEDGCSRMGISGLAGGIVTRSHLEEKLPFDHNLLWRCFPTWAQTLEAFHAWAQREAADFPYVDDLASAAGEWRARIAARRAG